MIHHIVSGIDDNLFENTVTVFHDEVHARKWYEAELSPKRECAKWVGPNGMTCAAHRILDVTFVSVEMPCIPDQSPVTEGILEVVYRVYGAEVGTCNTVLGDYWFRD
jgi:hypothetical protein